MSLSKHRSGDFHDESLFSLFDIPSTKHASTARLKHWMMRATLLFKQLAEEQVMTGTASYLLQWLESSSSATGGFDEYMSLSGPFDIVSTKHASIDSLKRWRQSTLVLNPSRRFRYTLNLKKQEKKEQTLRKIRSARAQGMPPEMYLKREAENERAIGKIRAYVHMNK